MKNIKLILFLLLAMPMTIIGSPNTMLKNGSYHSQSKDCPDKSILYIKRKDEAFYLVGRNLRFLLTPAETKEKELIDGCTIIHQSKVTGNQIVHEEISLPCISPNKKAVKKTKSVEKNILTIHAYNKFGLTHNQKTCTYEFKNED